MGGSLLSMRSPPYTEGQAVTIAATPTQSSKVSQAQFLRPLVKKELDLLPPQQRLIVEKEAQKDANILLKTMAGAGGLLAVPHVANAAEMTPSLKNLLSSVGAGAVVVLVAAAALLVVSNLDPVDRT